MNYEYAAPERHWSYTQKAVIAIVPKVSSSLSIIGSSFILYKIISPTNKNRDFFQSVRNNLLVLLSCCDLLSSCGYFLSTWALPSDDPQNIVVFNVGSKTTCNLQGFMIHFGMLSTGFYNTCLSIFFYLVVHYPTNTGKIKKWIPVFHVVSLSFPFITALISLLGDYFNPMPPICWISDFPRACVEGDCIRGLGFEKFRVLFLTIPIAMCIILITTSMYLLNKRVKRQEETMRGYTRRWSLSNVRQTSMKSRQVYRQSKLYVAAFAIVWLPCIAQVVLFEFFFSSPTVVFATGVIALMFGPLQGFLNALVYMKFNPLQCMLRMIRSSYRSLSQRWSQRASQATSEAENIDVEL